MRRTREPVSAILGVALLCVGTAQADITSGLVQHFKLDERSGTTVTDSAGVNDGVAEPTGFSDSQWVWGYIVGALEFNGGAPALDYVTASTTAWMASGPRTVSVWFHVAAGSSAVNRSVLGYRDGEDKLYINVDATTDALHLRVKQAPGSIEYAVTTAFAVTLGEWHHVIMTFGGGTTPVYYYDGQKISGVTALIPDPDFSGTPQLGLGAYTGSVPPVHGFAGMIDDFRVYSRVLTGAVDGGNNLVSGDLYELYTSREDDIESGLVQYFKLDETAGTDVADSAGSNDGTVVSARSTPLWAWEPAGYIDGALKVDGNSSDAEYVDASSAAWMAAGPRTVSMWFKPSEVAGTHNYLMGFRDGDDKLYLDIDIAGNLITRVQEQGGDDYSVTGPVVTQDVWHNIMMTFGGGTTPEYYYDGTKFSGVTALAPDPDWSPNPDFELGCYDNKINSYRGLIDEFRVYTRILTGAVDGGDNLISGDLHLLYNYTGPVPQLGTLVVIK